MNKHTPYDENDLIGYAMGDDGYMYPIYNFKPEKVVTKAYILCKFCSKAISPVGGPNYSALCLECASKYRVGEKRE